ncbi:HEPN domain-containing protein [Clostridium sp. Cult2]|uniref:HEPN domain-containing protein n=1 Tax=Clostridium sp. Cult2 TaxID=2079003 RepID=UPI001F19274F|nr:HEPN domain-containing protein [Clostridium sp. Cult2]MCF6465951.1 DNA-binding protein [Clostridium sp. Cult2]
MNNKDIANEWFNFAENDLKSAKFLLQMKPQPLEIICYHCQQSAEKYLKGYIAFKGGELIKTNDLTLLNKVCIEYDGDFQVIMDDTIELIDYGVHVRYPFHFELEEDDARKAIESAEKIQSFILNKVK